MILDLFGNPLVENTTNYRLFVVYHLTTLKALDGLAVVSHDIFLLFVLRHGYHVILAALYDDTVLYLRISGTI